MMRVNLLTALHNISVQPENVRKRFLHYAHNSSSDIMDTAMLYRNKLQNTHKLVILYVIKMFIISSLLISMVAYSALTKSQENIASLIESIDRDHQVFSTHIQKLLLNQALWRPSKYKNINALSLAVKEHVTKGNNILAANLIFNNISLLNENFDSIEIFNLIRVLLNQEDTKTAYALFKLINEQGDQTLISNTAYIFADYYFNRHNWDKTLKQLDGITGDLPEESYHHALLMQGISLQKQNKHRKAIESYKDIKPTSEYYISARLNMAIANIRQGWWTDGNTILQKTLSLPDTVKHEEALNRLYLTLGYSFMSQKYYRNSRDSFRNISIDSLFTNQALLGISLNAANQKDYVGALSSIRLLNNKKSYELTVDESYLLMPYFYEKLQQPTTASTGYLEAINYYQKRISEINSILGSKINVQDYPITSGINTTLKINNNLVVLSDAYPDYIFNNYAKLNRYKQYLKLIDHENIQTEFSQLNKKYESITVSIIHEILEKRVDHLNSYMDQSRFGLARLYDNDPVNSQQ